MMGLRRAWDGEDEDRVTILFPDGQSASAAALLPDLPALAPSDLGTGRWAPAGGGMT